MQPHVIVLLLEDNFLEHAVYLIELGGLKIKVGPQ
jgi:hypothetical protein